MLWISTFGALSLYIASGCSKTVQQDWLAPALPDGSIEVVQGDQFVLRWKPGLIGSFASYAPSADPKNVTLWITDAFDQGFDAVLARDFDAVTNQTFRWPVGSSMNDSWIATGLPWVFRFLPAALTYRSSEGEQVSSPHFMIKSDPRATSSPTASTSTPSQPSMSTPPTSVNSTGSASTGTPSASTAASQQTTGAASGLSEGATAGIAVGSAAGGALIAGLLFFLYRRRRRARSGGGVGEASGGQEDVALDGPDSSFNDMYSDSYRPVQTHELSDRDPQELAGGWYAEDTGKGSADKTEQPDAKE